MIQELKLYNFRCFSEKKIEFSKGINLIYGNNAKGKTSILEAICIIMRLSSPRTKSLKEVVKNDDSDSFIIYCKNINNRINDCKKDNDIYSLRYNIKLNSGSKFNAKKGFSVLLVNNENQNKTINYLKLTSKVVWISNDDKSLIKKGGEGRRKFLDFTLTQLNKEYLLVLRKCNKMLKIRNAYLKNQCLSHDYIETLDKSLHEFGIEIVDYRRKLIEKLNPIVQEYYNKISNQSNDSLKIEYKPSSLNIKEDLKNNRDKDIIRKSTSVGIHRDDIAIFLNGGLSSKFSSEGQIKSISLSLKLAQAHLLKNNSDRSPLILIDDISEDLDNYRKSNFLKFLPKDSQIFITSTSKEWVIKDIMPNNLINLE